MTVSSDFTLAGTKVLTSRARRSGFSLVELLTVVFIISLLIGVLIPSLNAARTQAKKASTTNTIKAIDVALEMFKNDNESDFRQTNGYPPSFAHPPIPGYNFKSHLGQFPFLPDVSAGSPPTAYGAHWLPAMLMGADNNGYVKRGSVPKTDKLNQQPWPWYDQDPLNSGKMIERQSFYLDPGNVDTKPTEKLPGRENRDFFPEWDDAPDIRGIESLPVIVDAFDQPILYYVANKHGRPTNMLEDERLETGDYNRKDPQQEGVPYYFHQDNVGFTGRDDGVGPNAGWTFSGRPQAHPISQSGAILDAREIVQDENAATFARYVMDRKTYLNLATSTTQSANAPLRPVNAESYLLISAGADGLFGNTDDVSNLPPWPDS